ncbi:MAG TPA: prolyl oligopeptidase family serine peptidase [Trebonia sp.]
MARSEAGRRQRSRPAAAAGLGAAFCALSWYLAGKIRLEALAVNPARAPEARPPAVPLREVTVPGPLGPLPAWYFPGRGSTFVIGVHGQNGTRGDLLGLLGIASRQGFPALAVTYRNDPGAPRDPSGYHRYGQTEWPDLEAAVRWSLARGARSVVLAGQSMGGGIVAAFLLNSALAPQVTRVVLDAPMLDLRATVGHQVDRFLAARVGRRLRPAARRLVTPPVAAAERIAAARFGVDWPALGYLRDTGWLRVPALVTHGDDDLRVPVATSVRLRRLRPDLVTLERFPGAGHLESHRTDQSRYAALVESFLAPVAP